MVLLTLPESSKPLRERVAIFASYSSDGFLPPQVLPYLAGLEPLTKAIVVVCDNDLMPGERERLESFATHVITGRHGEYDFGSYKRGWAWANENGLLVDADDLILCNDSCFGPVGSFKPMFDQMEARHLDFWGATDSHQFNYHLQSYWMVLSRNVFSSDAFKQFIEGIKEQENVQMVIQEYELGLTKKLIEAEFKAGALVENTIKGSHPEDPTTANISIYPLYTLEAGLPLVKAKALRIPHMNIDGQNRLLAWLKENAPEVFKVAVSDIDIARSEDADNVSFSLIMPTRNRAWCIKEAISSVVTQTHKSFELIIIDDGSTDNTKEVITQHFKENLAKGQIRYIHLPESVGVCNARNIGLAHARNPWIGYVDSDNTLRSYFLTTIANSVIKNPGSDAFYGQIINTSTGKVIGRRFERKPLMEGNYIDLGVFIHRKTLSDEFGGFDPSLKRMVDWDLIIRFTKNKDPIFLPRIFLDYSDEQCSDRISVKESFIGAKVAIHRKYAVKPTISTAIITYNHQNFLVEAIESALAQEGDFTHEILLSDDGSIDGSARIVNYYANKYPNIIRNISRSGNFGISDNYKHCFRQAAGNFVAILEGDDYWTDPRKNIKQAEFLSTHREAAMVFSKISLFDMKSNSHRLLKRQFGLKHLLSGKEFSENAHLNLIVNLSSTMYNRDTVRHSLPSSIYSPRISEITLAFYFDRIGKKIGFIDDVMSVYRLNPHSVWTGADRISQARQAIAIRENTLKIAKPTYRSIILRQLEEKLKQLTLLENEKISKIGAA